MQTLINILVFFFVLGIIIFIHELGHFIAAKSFKVYCSEFSLGMGPKIVKKKVGETEYQLRLLPIGGFVAMAGEADQEENELMKDIPLERTLKGIKTWQKVVVMLAGVFMNFVLAITILFTLYISFPSSNSKSVIGGFGQDSSALAAGLQKGDLINKINYNNQSHLIKTYDDITRTISSIEYQNKDVVVNVEYTRGNVTNSTNVKLTYNKLEKRYLLGIIQDSIKLSISEAFYKTFSTFWYYATMVFTTLALLITKTTKTVGQLSGPAGIYQVTASITQSGNIPALFNLVALLSINIGIFNLIPIPGLDGAQVLMSLIEKAIGREVPVKIKFIIQVAGLALVFGLMILVTINDFKKFFN